MKLLLTIATTLIFITDVFGQSSVQTSAIVAEGKRLYYLEMASWHGTDLFLERFKNRAKSVKGYFSYGDGHTTNCLFFSNEDNPKVLATLSFDSTYAASTAHIDSNLRDFTKYENDIYLIRKKTLEVINNDTLFKSYRNTTLNLIPLINGDEKKVYVLTGPQLNDVVIFGNDYCLLFDSNNQLISKKQLHKNIISINYQSQENEEIIGAMHTHLPETGEYITSTDICTLMLYEKFTKWKQHTVISEGYVSIWDCEKNQLTTLTRKAWENISKQQKKR